MYWYYQKIFSQRTCICDNAYIEGDVKVRNHFHKRSPQKDCVMATLNHKIPVVFHGPKNYDPHVIMQKLDKFNIKINVIPNR